MFKGILLVVAFFGLWLLHVNRHIIPLRPIEKNAVRDVTEGENSHFKHAVGDIPKAVKSGDGEAIRKFAAERVRHQGNLDMINDPQLALERQCPTQKNIPHGFELGFEFCKAGQPVLLPLDPDKMLDPRKYHVEALVTVGGKLRTVPDIPKFKASPSSQAESEGGNTWTLRGNVAVLPTEDYNALRVVLK